MRTAHRQSIDADLQRCLVAFPGPVPGVVDTRRPGFWARAWERGVAVPIAQQLRRLGELEGGHRLQAAYGIRSLGALREVVALLDAEGIAVVPLKGPLLAARLYPDYTWRPTSDVDILVRAVDLDATVATLERAGGRLDRPYAENRESHLRFNHHLALTFRGVVVEVHWRASNHFGRPLPGEPLIERSRHCELLGLRVRVLDPTDELLFLAVHAASHLWLRDILLLDLRLLAEREPVQWPLLARRSAELGLRRVVATTWEAAHERVGLQPPARPGLAARWVQQRLRHATGDLGRLVAEDLEGALRNLAAEALWVDSPGIAARFVGGRLAFGVARRLRLPARSFSGPPAAADSPLSAGGAGSG